MKKLQTILLITIMSSFSLTAQNNATKKADKHFSKFQFIDAAEDYMSLVSDGEANEYVYRQLAECYFNVFDTVAAEKWFEKINQHPPQKASERIWEAIEQIIKK